MKKVYEPLGCNPLAHLMKSERDTPPELNAVNERGEVVVEHYGTFYTREEWAKEVQGRHDWWEAAKARGAAADAIVQRERELEDRRYQELLSRCDGVMPYSEAQADINRAYEFDSSRRKGVTVEPTIPFGWLWCVIALSIGIGALMVAFGS